MLHLLGSTYWTTWRIIIAHWAKGAQEDLTAQLRSNFHKIPVPVTLFLNTIFYNAFFVVLMALVGFSRNFRVFAALYIMLPSIIGSSIYYHFKFGREAFRVTREYIAKYTHNWLVMTSLSTVIWTQNAMFYFALLMVEPLLPSFMQGAYSFPLLTYEVYLKRCVIFFYVLGLGLVCTLPMWRRGYAVNMELLGRRDQLSNGECALEILYMTCQSLCLLQLAVPASILLTRIGAPFHLIHFLFGLLEGALINEVAKYKFCIVHEVSHAVQPLYAIMHLEHHVCKGVYPTSSAGGLWEFYVYGCAVGWSPAALCMPYVPLHVLYCGVNVVVHTMWPSKKFAQWHTLHHVALADVYSLNVPTARDKAFSKYYERYHDRLEAVSPFFRLAWLSDLVGVLFAVLTTALFHYGLGWSIFSVWKEIQWL